MTKILDSNIKFLANLAWRLFRSLLLKMLSTKLALVRDMIDPLALNHKAIPKHLFCQGIMGEVVINIPYEKAE